MFFQMCSGTIGIGSSGRVAVGFDSLSTTVLGVGRGDGTDVVEVARPVVGLDGAVQHAVVGVGDVGGGELLPVTPLHVVPDVEGPHLAVRSRLPLGRQLGLWRHLLHRVADHDVVGQRPHLVGTGQRAEERVERVDLVGQRDSERHRLVVGPGCRGCVASGSITSPAIKARAAASRVGVRCPL